MTLTEQWKKGELPEGFYYFKMPDGVIEIASEYRSILYNLTKDADKIEVLAPVPSYEEWQKVLNIDFNNEVLRLENAKLKELLKECREEISDEIDDCTDPRIELFAKIDNAIGEKK